MADIGDQFRLETLIFHPRFYRLGHAVANAVEIFPMPPGVEHQLFGVDVVGQIPVSQRLTGLEQQLQLQCEHNQQAKRRNIKHAQKQESAEGSASEGDGGKDKIADDKRKKDENQFPKQRYGLND